jgi:ParB/RepB/Spo0J family partition protein
MEPDTTTLEMPAKPAEDPPNTEAYFIPLSDLWCREDDNGRTEIDESKIDDLARSLAAKGQLQSILVRRIPGPNKEPFKLVAGYRRYRAAAKAGLEGLFAIVKEYEDEFDVLADNAAENVERENLTLYDLVTMFHRFAVKGKWTLTRICIETGVEREHAESVYQLATEVAPQLLRILRNDESFDVVERLRYCAKSIRGHDKEQKFENQIKWWKAEGWKEWDKKRKPRGPNAPKTATADAMEDLASRIRSARGLKSPEGGWVPFTEAQANAVADAILWCANPKKTPHPL